MKIIGITGPAGSGKDTASDYLAAKLGIEHVSGGDHLRRLLTKLELEPKKSALGDLGTFLRTHYGSDAVIRYSEQQGQGKSAIIHSGLRAPAEANYILGQGGMLIYIDAAFDTRHQRIGQRQRPGDNHDRTALQALDTQEGVGVRDEEENLSAVKAISTVVTNNGTLDEFYALLDTLSEEIRKEL